MDAVHGEARQVIGQQHPPIQLPRRHQGGGGVQHAAVDDDGAHGAEGAQAPPAAAQPARPGQHPGQKAHDAHAEHLPRGPWPLAEQDVRGQHGHAAHQKTALAPQGHPSQNGQGQHRLCLGQHEKGRPARHAHGAQRGQNGDLPGPRSAPLKGQEEGQHPLQQHKQGNEIILPSSQVKRARKQSEGDQEKQTPCRQFRPAGEFFSARDRLDALPLSPAQGQGADQRPQQEPQGPAQLAPRRLAQSGGGHQGRQVGDPQGLDQSGQGQGPGACRQPPPPQGQRAGLCALLRRGTLPGLIRRLFQGRDSSAAAGDDIPGGDGSRQDVPAHAAGRRGIEPVAGEEVPGALLRRDAPLEKQGAPVGVVGAEGHVVADHNDGHTPGQQPVQDLRQLVLKGGVQALGGLVQQQHVRLQQQDLRQSRPLLLSPGQVIGVAAQQAGDAAQTAHPLHRRPVPAHVQQILLHRLLQKQRSGVLGQQGCSPVADDLSPLGPVHPGQQGEGGGLARPVAPQQSQKLPGAHT